MASSTISAPRVDRQFVEPGTGNLTQYGVGLLTQLLRRTGGTVADVIDAAGIGSQLADLSGGVEGLADALLDASAPHARIEAVEAELARLRAQLHDLQQGQQP